VGLLKFSKIKDSKPNKSSDSSGFQKAHSITNPEKKITLKLSK